VSTVDAGSIGSAESRFLGVVALDGPSGTGKSTVARRLASRLLARYLDTGAMYRAATLAALGAGVDLLEEQAVITVVAAADIDITTDPNSVRTTLNGQAVDAEIRSAEVTAAVSAVSAIASVRTQLVNAQRQIIGAGGIVVEGRDIATVVWPAASPKVYLTASSAMRAQRRADEFGTRDLADVEARLALRDRLDSSRTVSPLQRAGDAVELDTTYLSIDEVVQRLVDMTMAQLAGG
jgi:cytidylate kinase